LFFFLGGEQLIKLDQIYAEINLGTLFQTGRESFERADDLR